MKKYIHLPPDAVGMHKFADSFNNQHSKFIHSSWLLKSDYGRKVTMDEKDYTIYGLYDTAGSRCMIMLRPAIPGPFRIEDSKFVAEALGYKRLRNLVTGEEHKWDFVRGKNNYVFVTAGVIETVDLSYRNYENPEKDFMSNTSSTETYIDPLVQALQDDITDEGDTSN